jgi:predicted transposase/invertase (TIGR01784 family)
MDNIHHFEDKTYKQLFSHPKIVKDLLTGFIKKEFVKDVDFEKVEKIGASYVSETFKERETDLILKLDMKGEEAYLYLLVEFQSTSDKYIALRVLSYMLLFYEDLIKTKQVKDKLPPVFPMVIYTGDSNYNAPLSIEELISQPYKRLQKYVPSFTYHKLDLHELEDNKLTELWRLNNVLAAFFNLVRQIEPEKIIEAEKILSSITDFNTELGRFIRLWLSAYFHKHNIPFEINPEGGSDMLATGIKNIIKNAEEAEERGMERGKAEEKIEIVRNLLNINMPVEQIALVTGLSVEEIQKLME